MDAATSVDKAIDLLFHLHAEPEGRGVTAVSRSLGLPKSSVHRLLATLCRRGLLERDARGGYRPGYALVSLGLGALSRDPVAVLARPELEADATALGETVFLTGARGGAVIVLDKAEGTGFLRAAPRVGARVPAHATAVGRLFLAFDPDAVDLGPEPFPAYTAATPRTRAAVLRQAARAREEGFAESHEEWIPELFVVAAPVLAGGRLVAALAAAAPAARMRALGTGTVAARLRASADRVAARLAPGASRPPGVTP